MKVQNIMSKNPVFVKEDEFMTRARQLIRDSHFRSLPVVDNARKVTGIITEEEVLKITSTKSNVTVKGFTRDCPIVTPLCDIRDVAMTMANVKMGGLPVVRSSQDRELVGMVSMVDIFKNIDLDKVPNKEVKEIMTSKVKAFSPKDPVSKVWANIIELGYSGFPVIKSKREIIGMITRQDIIRAGCARSGNESPSVEKIMSTQIYSVDPDATIKEAALMMMKHDIGRLPVEKNGKLVGIVDRYDLTEAVIL
ncbi:MAG: CBS domain-containing protein [Methanocellales archaeon]|nr:CBS domain-containing protein [Methanocellales archaeon]MDD5447244.1 CBS domain-containing protein [Methanocellales archaeon]